MHWRSIPWLTLLPLVCACGPDDPSSTDGTTTEDSATGTVTSSGAGTSGGFGTGTTGTPWEPVAARGIHVDWVEANQGVGVPIGADGGAVGPAERISRLVKDRITLVRAFWTIEEGWEPREIEARLHINHPDGTIEVLSQIKLVEGDSFIGDLDRVFYWGIEAEKSQPGLTYHVDLWETTPDHDGDPEPDPPPRLPEDGSEAFVGIEDSYLVMKTVVVPVIYDDGQGCSTTPDTSDETMQLFQDLIFMQNPVDRLEFTLHEPIEWNSQLDSFGELNAHLSDLRFQEGALPETYYYGLIDVCSGGLGGAGGQAYGIPDDPTMENAYQRVSSGLSLSADWSAETFVHEVGHSQGRRHVYCNGEEGGPDPSYPHDGGVVGEWGFGVVDFRLRHPTVNKDYMTYCHPTWVGTWGWNKVYPIIETLSSWDAGYPGNGPTPEDPYGGSLLVGTILPSGKEIWHTVPGTVAAEDLDDEQTIELAIGEQVVATQPTRVTELPDTPGEVMIVAPLPKGFDAMSRITRVVGDERIPIDRATLSVRHHARSFSR